MCKLPCLFANKMFLLLVDCWWIDRNLDIVKMAAYRYTDSDLLRLRRAFAPDREVAYKLAERVDEDNDLGTHDPFFRFLDQGLTFEQGRSFALHLSTHCPSSSRRAEVPVIPMLSFAKLLLSSLMAPTQSDSTKTEAILRSTVHHWWHRLALSVRDLRASNSSTTRSSLPLI